MSDVSIRKSGRAGRITLTRPKALNALSPEMSEAIEAVLDDWRTDDSVDIIVIDAEGERAFCAGGDINDIYQHGTAGDYDYARAFWRQEYRMNAKIARFPKPVVTLMQGFTMGGGVGVGCHASHRIVGESAQIAMPECGIGLIPDVGGTMLLSRAPGALGKYLGLTAGRMSTGDAIHVGFADTHVPEAEWPALVATLEATGSANAVAEAAQPAPASPVAEAAEDIDRLFAGESLAEIVATVTADDSALAQKAAKPLLHNSPLSMACTLELLRRARTLDGLEAALAQEYRFSHRAQGDGDLLEGIRAQIIDKDRNPKWRHADPTAVTDAEVTAMLAPLGKDELELGGL